MPDLTQSLQGRDLGHLRIIADLWGLDFDAPDARVGLPRLAVLLLDRQRVVETIGELPSGARQALNDLIQHDGRLPWALFTRRYGAVREMGPGKRDRERPHRKATTPAEALWYRALVSRAFFETPSGPDELAFIPDDLLPFIPAQADGKAAPLGRAATPAERAHVIPASDRILDDACTLLAALRLPPSGSPHRESANGGSAPPLALHPSTLYPPPSTLQSLLNSATLLDSASIPLPDPTRAFLEAPRGESLAMLVRTWLHSAMFDELRLMPGLRCEGDWQNDPLRARQAMLDFLSTVEANKWWCLPAFVADIRQQHPDFQRPAGDYDSWFIRDEASGDYLRGFEHWNEVDGALIRYMITGPLHWLGILDLAAHEPKAAPTAFRYSGWAAALLRGEAPSGLPEEKEPITVRSDARLRAPRLAPRTARYLLSRFCEWDTEETDAYRYRLTPASLARARQQGLTVAHLLALLRRHADAAPPSLLKALERWDQRGTEARIETTTVLRLSSPEMLQIVRGSKAARFLGDPLGPTTVIVKPGAGEKVMAILAEMGYLGDLKIE